MNYSNIFVCLMGMGTVFFGLICLIALTTLMGRVLGASRTAQSAPAPVTAPWPAAGDGAPSDAMVAAVAAAIAEDLGADITGIRILSMKKL